MMDFRGVMSIMPIVQEQKPDLIQFTNGKDVQLQDRQVRMLALCHVLLPTVLSLECLLDNYKLIKLLINLIVRDQEHIMRKKLVLLIRFLKQKMQMGMLFLVDRANLTIAQSTVMTKHPHQEAAHQTLEQAG